MNIKRENNHKLTKQLVSLKKYLVNDMKRNFKNSTNEQQKEFIDLMKNHKLTDLLVEMGIK